MSRLRRIGAAVAVALPVALIQGCALNADPPPRQSFLVQLDAAAGAAAAQHPMVAAVYVAPVLIAAPFSGRNLVIQQSELAFATDPYAEFAASPVSMWTDAVRRWLDARGLFERVLPYGSSADASLTLETNLLEAVVDRRPRRPPSSRVTVRFLLLQSRAPHPVVLDHTFTRADAVTGAGAEREVAALSRAFEAALRDFEDALKSMPR